MKNKYVTIILVLLSIGMVVSWLCYYMNSEAEKKPVSENQITTIYNKVVNVSDKEDLIRNFIEGNEIDSLHLSNQLKKRVETQEFKTIWNQDISIYDVTTTSVTDWTLYSSIIFDIVLERDNHYQWVQLKTLWEKDKLMDIQLQPISYYERVKVTNYSNEEAISFVKQVMEGLTTIDVNDFGWRYQQQNPVFSQAVNDYEILESQLVAANDYGESLIKLKYKITLLDQAQVVEALFFVKSYNGKYQIEDIQIADVNRLGEEQ